MRLLHYLEIQNFKRFGDRQRIELDHPTVLIGPNNCGKTTALQALALWSQAVRAWYDAKGKAPPRERRAAAVNRLSIVAVPVQRTRYFWNNTNVRRGNVDIPLVISVGMTFGDRVEPVTMRFRNQGEDLVYCTPDDETLQRLDVLEQAARIRVELLYPMSGLETEEPILRPGRIDVLLGQGQTAQVLRNLCLIVARDSAEDWNRITGLMARLFAVRLDDPVETARGSIALFYREPGVKEPLDISLAGRGLQQMLLIFAYLYSHRGSILLIDEPDAHLEILRQKQVYVLLRDLAADTRSQVILVTHSEILLDEAVGHNLTLLLNGKADDLAAKSDILNALQHYGTDSYVRARQCSYVLYVEGNTDIRMLRALAQRLSHPVSDLLDERINVCYVQDNFPESDSDAEIARVERSFGMTPRKHFSAIRSIVPNLRGLAILDSDGSQKDDSNEGGLQIVHWRRYEAENYIVTPAVLRQFAMKAYRDASLFGQFEREINDVLDKLVLEFVFLDGPQDFATWKGLDADAARLLWEARTERIKLSTFAEEFFRRLASRVGRPMLLRKSELDELVDFIDPDQMPAEVSQKLDLLDGFIRSGQGGEQNSGAIG